MIIPCSPADLLAQTPTGLGKPRFRSPVRRGVALLVGASVLTGCGGGGGSVGNGALIRAVDASTNGGQSSVSLNGTNYTGTQSFFSNSFYLNLDSGTDTFTFSLGAQSGATYPSVTQTLSAGSYYSVIVLGRSDVTSTTDPRFPRLKVINDDPTAPATGQTRLRIIQAAPDAPAADVLIDGQIAAADVAYSGISGYLNLTGGNHTVQINQAGTSTVLMAAQTVSPAAGLVYSLYVLEPTLTPAPTYAVELLGDGR